MEYKEQANRILSIHTGNEYLYTHALTVGSTSDNSAGWQSWYYLSWFLLSIFQYEFTRNSTMCIKYTNKFLRAKRFIFWLEPCQVFCFFVLRRVNTRYQTDGYPIKDVVDVVRGVSNSLKLEPAFSDLKHVWSVEWTHSNFCFLS